MDDPSALRAFRTLAAAAAIDGKISQPEMQLLVRKAKEMRLDPPAVQQILSDAREGRLPLALPANQEEFDQRLGDIIDIVCADGRIETQERALLLRFAARMNLGEPDLMARIRPVLLAAQQRVSDRQQEPQPPRDEPRRTTAKPVVIPPLPTPPRRDPPRPDSNLTVGVGMADIKREVISAPPAITGKADVLTFTPGPVKLGGADAMSLLSAEITPVMLILIKSQLAHGNVEEVIQYAKRYLNLKDDDEARRVVEKVLRDNPDIKPPGR